MWQFLPHAHYGPFDARNPQQQWLVAVFVIGLTFAGYVARRIFGAEKGMLATAAIGGLIPDSVDRNLAGLALIGAVLANMLVKIGVVILYVGFKRRRSAIMALSAGAASLAGACAVVIFT